MCGDTLNPRQRTLRTLALKQLEAVQGTLQRLLTATAEQSDQGSNLCRETLAKRHFLKSVAIQVASLAVIPIRWPV